MECVNCNHVYNQSTNTYTCVECNQTHLCSKDLCQKKTVRNGVLVCDISGRCYGVLNVAAGYRNHVTQSRDTTPQQDKRLNHKGLLLDPSDTGLLIATKNNKRKKNINRRPSDRWVNVFSVHILIKKILMIKTDVVEKQKNIIVVELPNDEISAFSNLSIKMWRLAIIELSPKCLFKDFLVGFIFKIKFGLEIDKITICKPNIFLHKHYPHINALVKVGFSKKSLRLGTNYFMNTLRKMWDRSPTSVLNIFKDYNKITASADGL